ncbi:MAG: TIGR04282 family arsenosugar biosynthesis glycosyltransferase [Rhodospirillales bacterium]|nr:TIGR04282 family arsenosugar biosynthesis glycosyltransferase [Rhodospirillales bacterium]
MSLRRHLVVFARAPRLGKVKRRLARDLGTLAAWRFHRLTTAALLRRLASDPRWTTWLAVTPDSAAHAGRGLWPGSCRILPQGPGDLGRRMGRVIERLPPGPVAIVGSDIPGIGARHVVEAFRRLGDHDWVLGPARDGGYWLIGARRRPALRLPFAGVRWGGPHALADTLGNLAGQRIALLEQLDDVDTGADLARLGHRF